MNNSVNLTIIPARSGSKGIPNKNTKLLGGRPLLTYSIEAWKESGIGGRLIVSTDSEEIACVAREYGADVPFLRPAHLAQDSTPMWEVVRHALIELEPDSFDGVILLQPTAPFRRPHEISQALEMYYRQKADTAVTVSSVSAHYNPHWLFSCDNNGRLTPCMSQRLTHTRRQDLPELFHRTGGVYVVRPSLVSQEQTLIGDNTYGIVVDGTRQVNIDSPRDWQQAEKLVQAREHVQICQTKSKVYLGAAQRIQHLGQGSVRDFADLAATVPDVVDLSVGQPDFDVPRQIKDAAIRAIQDGFNHYTATGGLAELRDRLAEHVTAKHPLWQHYDRDGTEGFDVFVTAGVTGGIINAFLSLVDPGSEVLICEPYFGLYKEAVVMSGGTPIFIDTFPDFRVTADRIQPLITDRSKLLVLNSPCNPTGSVIEPGELTKIVELCRVNDIVILSDEIYSDFCYSTNAPYTSVADLSSDALVFRGFSKSHSMTGWRIAYVYGPARLIRYLELVQGQVYVCPPTSAQAAVLAALDFPIDHFVRSYARRRELLIDMLSDRLKFTAPAGGFYAFVKIPESLGMNDREFAQEAVSRGVLVIPGRIFSKRADHFRISITCPEERLQVGLERVCSLIGG